MPNWKLQGTVVVPDEAPAPESVAPAEIEGDAAVAFDPADFTVEAVKDHVEAHPDEAEAVLDAEAEGKNRSTLTGWLADFIVERDAVEG